MPLTEIGSAVVAASGTTCGATVSESVPVGQHVIVVVSWNSDLTENVTSISDSDGVNTYAQDDAAVQSTNNAIALWSTKVANEIEAGDIITANWGVNVARKTIRILKATDLDATTWMTENGRGSGSNASSVSASLDANIAAGDYYLVAAGAVNMGSNTTLAFTADTGDGFSEIGSELVSGASTIRASYAEYKSITAPGGAGDSAAGTTDRTTGWVMIVIAYKKASSSAISKAGGHTSAMSSGSPKAETTARAGGATHTMSSGAPWSAVAAKASGSISDSSSGASKLVDVEKAGGHTLPFSTGGIGFVDQTFSKAGGWSSQLTFGISLTTNALGPWSVTREFTLTVLESRSGGWSSAGSFGGSRSAMFAKVGGPAIPHVSGASRSVQASKTGGSAIPHRSGAQRAYRVARAGGATVVLRLGGPQGTTNLFGKAGGFVSAISTGAGKTALVRKSNGATMPVSTGATKTTRYARTGGVILISVHGSPKTFIVVNTGGHVFPYRTGGERGGYFGRTGGLTSSMTQGATRRVTNFKSGGVRIPVSLGGTGVRTQIVVKIGGMSSAFSTGSPRSIVVTKSGGARVALRIGGARLLFGKSGGVVMVGRFGGTLQVARVIPPGAGKPGVLMGVNRTTDNRLVGA